MNKRTELRPYQRVILDSGIKIAYILPTGFGKTVIKQPIIDKQSVMPSKTNGEIER